MKKILKCIAGLILLALLLLVYTESGRTVLHRMGFGRQSGEPLSPPVTEEEKLPELLSCYELVFYRDSEGEIPEKELEKLRELGVSLFLDLTVPEEGLLQLFDAAFPVRLDEEAMQLIWEKQRYDLTREEEFLILSEGETLLRFRRISDPPD